MNQKLNFTPLPGLEELINQEGIEQSETVCGFECRAVRLNTEWAGFINGYIRIPEGHPWYGRTADGLGGVSVHGGVTYSENGLHTPNGTHTGWWIGFDTAHWKDLNPVKLPDLIERPNNFQVYRTMDWVMEQLRSLAKQAKEAQKR